MAKKTNKTDHVLNLLAGAAKKEEGPNKEEAGAGKAQPPVDPLEQMKSNVSVVHTSENKEEVIADAVKQSLEQEMMGVDSEEKQEFIDEPEEPIVQEEPEEPEISEVSEKIEDLAIPEETEIAEKPEEPEKSEVSEAPKKQETAKAEPEKEEKKERDFEFVNVMERLVRDKVVGYMEQFGNCTCDRCIEDTTALALSNLPSKCVVVNKAAVSPLLNFYTKKYAGQITVEITKACITVQENPYH